MKIIELLRLEIENFKGCKHFIFEPNGKSCDMIGRNEAGKTRCLDAICWTLFNKDSKGKAPSGKSKFNIKDTTIIDRGETAGLDAKIILTLLVDNKKIELKKVYSENRGSERSKANKVLKRHINSYWINDDPIKLQKDYDKFIEDNIATEQQFKFITALGYFNDNTLHAYDERRKFLFEMAGNPTDKEIINSDPKLKELSVLLNGRTVESFKNIYKDKRKLLSEKIEKIPIQIEENTHNMPDIKGINIESAEKEILIFDKKIEDQQSKMNQLNSGGAIAKKKNELSLIESQMLDLKNNHRSVISEEIGKAENIARPIKETLSDITIQDRQLNQEIERCTNTITKHNEIMVELRKDWNCLFETKFEFSMNSICPTCSQPIPIAKINCARESAKKQFNIEKSKKLENITAKGKELKEQGDIAQGIIDDSKKELLKIETEEEQLTQKLESFTNKIEGLKQLLDNYQSTEEYKSLVSKQSQIQEEIKKLQEGAEADISKIVQKIVELKNSRSECQSMIDKVKSTDNLKLRNEELKTEEKKLSAKIEEIDHYLKLCDQFIIAEVNYSEDKINSMFKITKWKLFEKQLKGSINNNLCEATNGGVAYSTDLNNGNKVLVDLDISNTLSKYYGINLFKFVDNAESVTEPLESDSQLIKMKALKEIKEGDKFKEVKKGEIIIKFDDKAKPKKEIKEIKEQMALV